MFILKKFRGDFWYVEVYIKFLAVSTWNPKKVLETFLDVLLKQTLW